MAATRKTKAEKQMRGTLKKAREQARTKVADPASELEDAREALTAMKANLRFATAEIASKSLLITTTIGDSHGKLTTVERINPCLKVQREAFRAIVNLKKQIAALEEEAAEKNNEQEEPEWEEFKV